MYVSCMGRVSSVPPGESLRSGPGSGHQEAPLQALRYWRRLLSALVAPLGGGRGPTSPWGPFTQARSPPAPADLWDARGCLFSGSRCPVDRPREGTHALPPPHPGLLTPSGIWGGGRGVRGGVPTPSPGEGHLSGANGGARGSWGLLPPECRARAPGAHSVGCGPPGSTHTSESLRQPSPRSRGDRTGGSLGAGCQKLCGVCMRSQVDHIIGTLPRLGGRAAPPQVGPSHLGCG